MSRRVTRKAEARLDLLQYFVYIGERNLDAAERFLQAAEEAFTKLADMPGMGAERDFGNPVLAGLRSSPQTASTSCAWCTGRGTWNGSLRREQDCPTGGLSAGRGRPAANSRIFI